jgi:hypothetical protein
MFVLICTDGFVDPSCAPKPPSGQWHRNLLLALCFPKFGEPRQSSMPFGKIENDAL